MAVTPDELRQWRQTLDLSRAAFARWIGVNVRTACRWESGESPVPPLVELALPELRRRVRQARHVQKWRRRQRVRRTRGEAVRGDAAEGRALW